MRTGRTATWLASALLLATCLAGAQTRRMSLSAYRATEQRWHAPGATTAQIGPDGRMLFRLTSINGLGTAEVMPERQDGGFDDAACAQLSRVLGDRRSGTHAPMDRRLLEVIYSIARHFEAGQVRVVSGYRPESHGSNHSLGRAADIVVPGVPDEEVAAYARSLGFVGVGVYPRSGFVHVDVRTRSFFWVDRSAPGRTTRRRSRRRHGGLQEVFGTQAQQADARARAAGISPLGGTANTAAPTSPTEDDESDDEAAEGSTPGGG